MGLETNALINPKLKTLLGFVLGWMLCHSSWAQTWSATSKSGRYEVKLTPQQPLAIGKSQAWVVHLQPLVEIAQPPKHLSLRGAMPAHGHGLPSTPQFTRYLGDQKFLLEDLRFNMAGRWILQVTIGDEIGFDNAVLKMQIAPGATRPMASDRWSPVELALMDSIRLTNVRQVDDASNRLAGLKPAQRLGRLLFNDSKLSRNGKVSCATCHQPKRAFSDGRALAFGSAAAKRNTPTLLSVASNTWFYWDGRRDSLWSQALSPLETMGEMDNDRTSLVRYFLNDPVYYSKYAELPQAQSRDMLDVLPKRAGPFDPNSREIWQRTPQDQRHFVNTVFADIGKLIAAYETTLDHPQSRFDRFAEVLLDGITKPDATLTKQEQQGLKLFLDVDKTHCLRCHNGPLLTNQGFHTVGSSRGANDEMDFGRMLGRQAAIYDTFNCASTYSDANRCRSEHRDNATHQEAGAFKVPTLRSLNTTAPYFHDGRFSSLTEVLTFYQLPTESSEVPLLQLSALEVDALITFLRTLSAQ